jgi:RND family efflux transporter MFP subunit
MLRRDHLRRDQSQLDRMSMAFDLVAVALERTRFNDACMATMTELAMRLDCDLASTGFVKGGNVAVAAISHAAQFGQRMNLIRTIGAAMDEAVDQKAIVILPARSDWDFRIDRAHQELAHASESGSILTVPLHVGGRFFGAITLQRPASRPFQESDVTLCDCVAGVLGPILEEKRQNDRIIFIKAYESLVTQLRRLFGPDYFGRKIVAVSLLLVTAFFAIARQQYAVTSLASIEGSIQRSLVAPFDGYVATQSARAGDIVRKGEVMASLDDKDLITERLKWTTKRAEQLTEYGKALAKQERADAQVIQAQMDQARAQIELLDEEIKRTQIRAPFDGIVISGDLSKSVGAALKRGDEMFQVAPLDSYRVILKVDERDIGDLHPGQDGTLVVTSIPLEPLHYKVTRITPIAEVEEGANDFRVEAELLESSSRLRPGMKGVAKTDIDERLIIRIWTQRLIDWLRMAVWKWLP